jgi:hypothetical protein
MITLTNKKSPSNQVTKKLTLILKRKIENFMLIKIIGIIFLTYVFIRCIMQKKILKT